MISSATKKVSRGIVPSVSRGFTLLELLIVIAILAILAAVVIIVLNPAQTLKQARDAQRLSDLSTLKSAVALYATTVSPVDFDASVTVCSVTSSATGVISYSLGQTSDPTCTADVAEGAGMTALSATFAADACRATTVALTPLVDGTGWIPIVFTNISGGTPLASLPMDPTNTIAGAGGVNPVSTDFVYRYTCDNTNKLFEFDAILESDKYKETDNLDAKDGGDNAAYYEVGTSLLLIGTGNNF